MKSPSIDQKSLQASASSFVFCQVETSPRRSSLRSSLLTGWSRRRVDSRTSQFSHTILLFDLRLGIHNVHLFVAFLLPLHWAFEHGFLKRPHFPAPQCLQLSPFQISPANSACPRNILGKTFLPIGGASTGLSQKSDDIQPFAPNGMTGPSKVSKSPVHEMFSHTPRGLGHAADKQLAFRRISPTTFKPSIICNNAAEAPAFYPAYRSFSYSVRLGSMGCWSAMIPYPAQDLPNSNELSVWLTFGFIPPVRGTFVNSISSPEKFSSYTGKIQSIDRPNPAPLQHICDCFEIHRPHSELCDLPVLSHQFFCPRYRINHQLAFCKEPL